MALGPNVHAHSTLRNTITIDGNYITELETPPPSELLWIEHVNRTEINAYEEVIFELDTDRTEQIFGQTDLNYTWRLDGMGTMSGPRFTVVFPKTGSYVLHLTIYKDNQVLTTEEIGLQVGALPQASRILLGADKDITNRLLTISRSETYTFRVAAPDTLRYKYTWDLGDKDVIDATEVSKQFSSTLLPNYVVLRTTDLATDTYTDSYIRIESELDFENSVPKPPFRPAENVTSEGNHVNISPVGLVLGVLFATLVVAIAAYIQTNRRERSHQG